MWVSQKNSFLGSRAVMIPRPKVGFRKWLIQILNKFVGDGVREAESSNLFVYTRLNHFCNRKFLNLFFCNMPYCKSCKGQKLMGGSLFPFFSDEDAKYSEKYQGKLHLHARNRKGFCFDTSSKRKLTSNEHKRASFSPCRLDANQVRAPILVYCFSLFCINKKHVALFTLLVFVFRCGS